MPGASSPSAVQRRRRPKRKLSPEASGAQYHLKAIGRALDVLDCFSDEHAELGLKEISHMVGLPESSLFRILLTLESRRYLIQNVNGTYALAPKLLLGRLHERAERVRNIVHPHLQSLASRFDETATSAYLFEDRVQALDTVETFHAIRMTNKPGRVLPPHASSLGKAIAAFQSPGLVDRMLEVYGLVRRTDRTLVDRQALLNEFERIRSYGYAIDREESVKGGVCVGAAIRMDKSPVMAAISVSTPLVRLTAEREIEITHAVLDAAHRAAADLERL